MTDHLMNSGQPVSCTDVESLASEWVDEALAPDMQAAIASHLDGCAPCTDLVADLAAIAGEARTLPRLAPSRDLWAGIAARIATPVVVLETTPRASVAPPRRWWRSAVAAAALVAVTAGVTWRVATDRVQRETIAAVAPAPASSPDAPATGSAPALAAVTGTDSGPVPLVATPAAMSAATPAATSVASVASRAPRTASGARQAATAGGRRASPSARAVPEALSAPDRTLAPLPAAAQAYDREITGMRALVTERRKDLDPATVRVLERNLKIIDQAIAESRAALAHDPASGLLAEHLTRAMKRKLELLRTAADLPPRIS